MIQEFRDKNSRTEKNNTPLPRGVIRVARILSSLGLKVFIIGARSIIAHGVDLGRETRDWDIIIDKPFTPELRDSVTRTLRSQGFKVQWRKWGFLVKDDIHIDINYAPLTFDSEFEKRSMKIEDNILLPSIEDLIILKLMSGEKKDIDDVKKILVQSWQNIDKRYLKERARQAGLERELGKVLRRLGLK